MKRQTQLGRRTLLNDGIPTGTNAFRAWKEAQPNEERDAADRARVILANAAHWADLERHFQSGHGERPPVRRSPLPRLYRPVEVRTGWSAAAQCAEA